MKEKRAQKSTSQPYKLPKLGFQERIKNKKDIDEGRVGLRYRNQLTCDIKSLKAMLA